MSRHPVRWQAPQPLWSRFGATTAACALAADQPRPAILRFATDDFMDQLLGTLARDPSRIDALLARPETWRSPAAAEPVDLIERTPVPRIAQSSVRTALARLAKPTVGATSSEATLTEQAHTRLQPLKLYQPAHQRFYIAGASLICGVPGLPERAIDPAAEQVNFVIRRLVPEPAGGTTPEQLREFAFVSSADAARWQRVSDDADERRAVAGEELLPVFPLTYLDDGGRTRTLWGGFVPVGRREEYMGAAVDRSPALSFAVAQREGVSGIPAPAPKASKQARLTQFQMEVAEPWKNLIRTSFATSAGLTEPSQLESSEPASAKTRRRFDHNLAQQHASWLILLDFADYLAASLPELWAVIDSNGAGATALSTQQAALYEWLGTATMPVSLQNALRHHGTNAQIRTPLSTLRDALKAMRAAGVRAKLEAAELTYTSEQTSLDSTDWPAFHFVLAGLNTGSQPSGPFAALDSLPGASAAEVEPDPLTLPATAHQAAARVDRLTALVGRALVAKPETEGPPVPFAARLRDALAANVGDSGWFVIRFVYTNRDCGPLHPPEVSAATQRFQLAAFFDPDAPARPIRIPLPVDTSAGGLRKFNRNTAFVMSDLLCGQVQRAKGLGLVDLVRSVLPWPLHKDLDLGAGGPCRNSGGLNIGMICSLSIPIITICALILLMIIVSLLDFIFRWLPFFIMCFPIPGLKGKKAAA
jgi:hypothetical protein